MTIPPCSMLASSCPWRSAICCCGWPRAARYRPVWSEQILAEMARALRTKLHRSTEEVAWRRQQMKEAFPEAMVTVPSALLKSVECIPHKGDKHVLAAAIMARRQRDHHPKHQAFPERLLREIRRTLSNARRFPNRPLPSPPATRPRQTRRPGSRHLPEPGVRDQKLEASVPKFLRVSRGTAM